MHEGVQVDRIQALPAADVCRGTLAAARSPTVGNVGALGAREGQRYLVDAAPAVVRAPPDTHFLIFRRATARRVTDDQRPRLEHRVSLAGFRPDILFVARLDLSW